MLPSRVSFTLNNSILFILDLCRFYAVSPHESCTCQLIFWVFLSFHKISFSAQFRMSYSAVSALS